jgi:NAD(P)-dependent dehydrogenase (short-subunit alcohol dehydrogenase family)
MAPLEFFPLEDFDDVIQTNLIGSLRTTQVFLPLLRQGCIGGRRPRIVNISSVVSLSACRALHFTPQGMC